MDCLTAATFCSSCGFCAAAGRPADSNIEEHTAVASAIALNLGKGVPKTFMVTPPLLGLNGDFPASIPRIRGNRLALSFPSRWQTSNDFYARRCSYCYLTGS